MDPIDQALDDMPSRSKYGTATRDKGCVGRALELHPERADAIRRVVERSHDIGARVAARILADHGIDGVADQAIRRHRNGTCACQTR